MKIQVTMNNVWRQTPKTTTYIVETMIVGIKRSGTMSNTIRADSQAAGLDEVGFRTPTLKRVKSRPHL